MRFGYDSRDYDLTRYSFNERLRSETRARDPITLGKQIALITTLVHVFYRLSERVALFLRSTSTSPRLGHLFPLHLQRVENFDRPDGNLAAIIVTFDVGDQTIPRAIDEIEREKGANI